MNTAIRAFFAVLGLTLLSPSSIFAETPAWAEDVSNHEVPNQSVQGKLQGIDFSPDRVEYQNGIFSFREGGSTIMGEREIILFMFLPEDEKLEGKTFKITPSTGYSSPHVHTHWKPKGSDDSKTDIMVQGYSMRLDFEAAAKNGKLNGRIYLALPKNKNTVVAGKFSIPVAGATIAPAPQPAAKAPVARPAGAIVTAHPASAPDATAAASLEEAATLSAEQSEAPADGNHEMSEEEIKAQVEMVMANFNLEAIETPSYLVIGLAIASALFLVISSGWFLKISWKESKIWLVVMLTIPLTPILFALVYIKKTYKPVLLWILAAGLMTGAIFVQARDMGIKLTSMEVLQKWSGIEGNSFAQVDDTGEKEDPYWDMTEEVEDADSVEVFIPPKKPNPAIAPVSSSGSKNFNPKEPLTVGDPVEKVYTKLGEPNSQVLKGNDGTLVYRKAEVWIHNGHITKIIQR